MTATVARVEVNGIEVGSLPVDLYNGIVQEVRSDKSLYLKELRTAFVAVGRLIAFLPVMIVMAGMALIVFQPETVADALAALMKATPQQIAHALRMVVIVISVVSALAYVLALGLVSLRSRAFKTNGRQLPAVFDREINRRIRALLEVPAEGDMTVTIAPSAAHA